MIRHLAAVFSCAASFLAPLAALATPQQQNATELWINPAESGWGLYLAHQGDTLFGTLFVYGPDNQPRWYSASGLRGNGTYTGELFESHGAGFGQRFDQDDVFRRPAGSMTVTLHGQSATVTYVIDGVRVTREVVPFAFKAISLAGRYVGDVTGGSVVNDAIDFTVTHSGTSFGMTSQGSASGSCNYNGVSTQTGSKVNVSGNYSCSNGRSGPFTISDADLTTDGFTARWNDGRIAAVRMGRGNWAWNGWMSDLWIYSGESGWGFNMIGQGEDNVFGTLFHYDADRKPKWYSMANMIYMGRGEAADDRGTYIGSITESTGPWFGQPTFDPALVTRRNVGSITMRFRTHYQVDLSIDLNGVHLERGALHPFAFTANNVSGTYVGHVVDGQYATGAPASAQAVTITVNDSGAVGSAFAMSTNGPGGNCGYSGFRQQTGQRVQVFGTYSCADGRNGPFALMDIEVSAYGFTAALGTQLATAFLTGHMGGVRSGGS
ncbi:MAG TPA: hypothetical protein VM051_00710 [Usitatibacter sp.]|nr:hypothetical protein [Usitatibacter sp.]